MSSARDHTTSRPAPTVRVLGGVSIDGAEISALLERRLLAILVANRGRPLRLEALVDELWPEASPRSAANTLMSKISRLRQVLGRDGIRRTSNGFVLQLGVDGSDVERFERLARLVFDNGNAAALDDATAALALWRGEPFGEFAADAFAHSEVIRLTSLWERVAERHAELLSDAGHLAAALVAAEHLMVRLPASERLCAVRARSLARLGRPVDALQCLHEFRRYLVDQRGSAPGRELVEIEADLLRVTAGAPEPTRSDGGRSRVPALFQRPILGRETAIESLIVQIWQPGVVALIGEPGIGKTRLVHAVAERCETTRGPVAWIDATVASSLDSLLRAAGGSPRTTGDELWAEVLGRLAPASLVVLDGCDDCLPACIELVERLVSVSSAAVVTTSRHRPDLVGAVVRRVDPLTAAASQQLLTRRAAERNVEVPAELARRIVEQLDGLPLAVELVAVRLADVPVAVVADELDGRRNRIALLAGSTPTGLVDQIVRSHEQLSSAARRCFGALSHCSGGAGYALLRVLAARVGVADPLAPVLELVDAGLVRVEPDRANERRYRLLAPIADVGRRLLERSGEADEFAAAFADTMVSFAESMRTIDRSAVAGERADMLATEMANLRVAYQWLVGQGRWEPAARLVAALEDESILRERIEVDRWAEELAAHEEVAASLWAAPVLGIAANATMLRGDFVAALELARTALSAIEHGARPSVAPSNVRYLLGALREMSTTGEFTAGPSPHAERLVEYTTRTGDPLGAALAAFDEAYVCWMSGQATRGLPAAIRLVRLGRQTASPLVRSMGWIALAWTRSGINPARAVEHAAASEVLARSARCTLVERHAARLGDQLRAAGQSGYGRADLFAAVARVRAAVDLDQREQTLQEVAGVVPILTGLGRWDEAAFLYGGLERSLWGRSAVVQAERRRLVGLMGADTFEHSCRPGRRADWRRLVAYLIDLTEPHPG